MTDANEVTLESYQQGWQEYLRGTPDTGNLGYHGPFLPGALAMRPAGSTVLEIGSATGHDAKLMEAQGIPVDRSDATPAFVKYLRGQGYPARHLNILDALPDEGAYGMVYAWAVFQHFSESQMGSALRNCARALQPGGILAFSVRRGDAAWPGHEWQERKGMGPRWFQYWEPGPLWAAVENAGLTVKGIHLDSALSIDADRIMKTWLMVTAEKPPGPRLDATVAP
jgi:SAM-dependent methyltransferase